MPEDGSPYSYFRIVQLFRRFYRECYMRTTLRHGGDHRGKTHWPRIELSLRDILAPEMPNADAISNSLLVIDFNRDLGTEVWAMNLVIKTPTRLIGYIAVDKRLYEEIVDQREESQKRKAILAHEWLEVLHTICNYEHLDNIRAVAGKVEMFALMGAFEFGLPWEDGPAHLERLAPALRDLLVSSETIHRMIREDQNFGTVEHFNEKFIAALRNDRGEAKNFLLRFAETVSTKINVPRRLCQERVHEVLRLRL